MSNASRVHRASRMGWRTSPAVLAIVAAASLPIVAVGAAAPGAAHPQAGDWSAEPLGTIDLGRAPVDPAVANVVGDAPVGGISGLDSLGGDRYLALSDDRAAKGPARAYGISVPLGKAGEPLQDVAAVDSAIALTDPSGVGYAEGSVDPESIRVLPDGGLLWTSEGAADDGQPPAVIVADASGREQRRFDVPAHHLPDGHGTRGVRDNLAYEGLTLLGDGRAATLAENPLAQDGPVPGAEPGALTRLTVWDIASGTPVAEYAYPLDAVPAGSEERGATEILAAGDGSFIVLERSYIAGRGTVGSLSVVTLDGADDVLAAPALTGAERPVVKRHLLDLAPNGENVDNVESLAWGPVRDDGRRTLLIATDDNFNPGQRTLVHAFAIGMPAQ